MTAGLRLDLDVIRNGAFDKIRYILGVIRPRYGDRLYRNVEIISVDPGYLVKRIVRKCDAVVAAIADGVETVGKCSAWCLPHYIQDKGIQPKVWFIR